MFSLLEMRDQVRSGRWDLVVVDCAPSTETLRLLSAPEVLARYVQRLLPMERRIARIVSMTRRSPAGRGPGGLPVPGDAVVEAAEQFASALAATQEVLRAPGTSVRLVMTAESVVLAETRRTWTALALHGFTVDAVVANRLFPSAGGSEDAWRRGWIAAQAATLAEARSSFAPVPVRCAGYAAAEPVGCAALAELAENLYGPPGPDAAAALLAEPAVPGPFRVDRSDEGYLFHLPMPLATRETLDLGRRGDELVVTVEGRRRVVALPSALRRCTVAGASLRDGDLSVRFVPDPGQWRAQWMPT